jgi:hypothetical protein
MHNGNFVSTNSSPWPSVSSSKPQRNLSKFETDRREQKFSNLFNTLKPSDYYIYHPLYHTKTLHSAHAMYLCVSCGSHNKLRLFP